jgi:dephospho-CoA kinase
MLNNKRLIGLTGTYCAGKTHVAALLEQRLLPVLELDKLGHGIIETEKERILARFGGDILTPGGLIDRKLLGNKVFGKPDELAALEGIIHPGVNRETIAWIDSRKEQICVINAALLHRSAVFDALDAVIIVKAPFLVRLRRARKRDRLPWVSLLKRFRSQRRFNSQYFKENTDTYKVENSGFFGFRERFLKEKLEKRIDEILSIEGSNRV